MARPRVIVADTDESYVIPLQKKFAELFADKIDLEIITDKDYFNQLFSLSQHADILLVSDTLYNSGLKKHDIRHLMILSEHYEPGQTDELDICRLFKYTSVREIFNEITGRCKDTLYAEQDAGKETKIILITSASGGVGKTSVAFGLCRCLERNYKKTLYVNADRLQSFQWMLENGEPIRDASVYAGLSGNLGNVYRIVRHVIRKEGFSYLPPFKAALMSLGIPYRVFALLAEAARKEQEYDYIVIDADSVFDEEKAALMQLADKILIVTKQTEYAVKATNELIQNVNRNNSDKYIFLCNDLADYKTNLNYKSSGWFFLCNLYKNGKTRKRCKRMNDSAFLNSRRTGIFKDMSNGTICIPKDLRDNNGLEKNDRVELIPMQEGIYIRKAYGEKKCQ